MRQFSLADTALVSGAIEYITGGGVSQRLYKGYISLLSVLALYPHRQGLPNKSFVRLELRHLRMRLQ
jgi:hypothetical protein